MSSSTIIKVGKNEFKITESIMKFGDRIISHTFKIGGTYDNCIGVSYTYNNLNKPTNAKIPHALYEPECSMDSSLEKGSGTILMLKSLLKYVYTIIPSVASFTFDDMSHIDCVEKDMTQSPPRKPIKPLNLAYFSIAYNGQTWYEKHFNARMVDTAKYNRYRERIRFLTDPTVKVDYVEFLRIAQPPPELYSYLEKIYNKSDTYRSFFESIPKAKRCDILYSWLVSFMEYYLKDVFSTNDWVINILTMNNTIGGANKYNIREYPSKYRLISHRNIHVF